MLLDMSILLCTFKARKNVDWQEAADAPRRRPHPRSGARAGNSIFPTNSFQAPPCPVAQPRCLGRCRGKPLPERYKMTRFLLAGAMAFGMMSGIALAQSTTLQTTTTTAPVVLAPPTGTLSTSTSTKSIGPDGARTDTSGTTYRNSNGVASDTEFEDDHLSAAAGRAFDHQQYQHHHDHHPLAVTCGSGAITSHPNSVGPVLTK